VVGADSAKNAAVVAQLTDANKANDGYFPAIGLVRDPVGPRRSIGLTVDNRLKTVDAAGTVGYIGDSITQLDTSFYKDKSVTLAKLADSLVALLISPGIIQAFAGPTPPTGWLICDGHAVLRATYPALFTAIGTYWGGGDASGTQFNLPDLRGRSIIGYVNTPVSGITARAFAERGGEEKHTISVSEMPSHTHVQNAHNHTQDAHAHDYATLLNAGGGTKAFSAGSNYPFTTIQTAAATATNQPATAVNQANGGGVAANIMQPYGVAYYIIKT